MTQEELIAKRSELETLFNQKKEAREARLSEASSLLEEMHKLQGAYNVYSELIEAGAKPAVKVKGEKEKK